MKQLIAKVNGKGVWVSDDGEPGTITPYEFWNKTIATDGLKLVIHR